MKLRRRLTLSHDGRIFLDRWGLVYERIGGFYLHHIAAVDPGLDLHDHPWSFVSIILWGSYTEGTAPTASASAYAKLADRHGQPEASDARRRVWRRWSVHKVPLTTAHRITSAKPHTWTIVFRGPTRRVWGFYLPTGRVEWTDYDYAARRPNKVASNDTTKVME